MVTKAAPAPTTDGERHRAPGPRVEPSPATSPQTQRRVRAAAGELAAATMRRLESDLNWYRGLPADERSWVGLVAQTGITAFVDWFADPTRAPASAGDIFTGSPAELTRSISLQHTLQLVRIGVDVVEEHSERLAAPGEERALREAVLRYSREVAFSAAEVYARAAEARGAWDARLEALVVDALVRGDVDDSLRSRVAALGWSHGDTMLVAAGGGDGSLNERSAKDLRHATRREADVLVGIHGERLLVFLRGVGDLGPALASVVPRFGPGPVVVGPAAHDLAECARSAQAALSGLLAAPAWTSAPRPVAANELLPERVLVGDPAARTQLVTRAYAPLAASTGALLETLEAYLGTGRSLEAAARTLYVHPNTVRYRLRRVAGVTGWDPLDARDCYVLQTALALGRLGDTTVTGAAPL